MTLLSNRGPELLRRLAGAGNNVCVRGKLLVAVFVVVAVVTVAGCGGSARQAESTNRISIPAYGVVPARTATTTTASAAVCRTDAGTLVRDARGFLHHFGPAAAYPADLNYVIVRDDLARFRSDGCAPAVLGRALSSGLTSAQRNALVTNLPSSMAQALRTALSDA
jgi:hypothetical protein